MGDEQEEIYYDVNVSYPCPSWAPILGFTGIVCSVAFASTLTQS